jgi:hypothetical protein
MGRRGVVVLAAGIVAAGGAAGIAGFAHGGGAGSRGVDTSRLQADIESRLPAGWSDSVDVSGGRVNVRLVRHGDMAGIIRSLRANRIINPDDPEMMKLLPADPESAEYVFHYSDSNDKGTLLRVAAGKGHHSPHPELQFMSRDFISAEIGTQHTLPTPIVIP